jgi:prophage tail gpP-like protein
MAYEQIKVSADGYQYEGWESVQIISELEMPWIDFTLSTTEIAEPGDWGKPGHSIFRKWNFPPGTNIEIFATGDFVIAGIVYAYMPSADPDRHMVTVNGSTKGRNWAESSVDHKTGNWENTTDAQIIQDLAKPYNARILDETKPEKVPYWQVRQGATNYAETVRLLSDFQKMLSHDKDGMVVTDGSAIPYSTVQAGIIQGENVLRMSAVLQTLGFYRTDVVGQKVVGIGEQEFNIKGTAIDPSKMADRRKRLIAQRDLTPSLAARRAEWEMMRQSGHELEATFLVPGWRDQHGQFWRPNSDVYVWAPMMQIDCVLRVKRVILSQTIAQGTVAEITLVDPRAYGGPQTACSSGAMWMIGIGGGAR